MFKELKQGNFFGEISLFTLMPRCCSARCIEFVETLSLSRENMDGLLERNPDANRICEYIFNQCQREDLAILGIRCFLCTEIGHVATSCKKYLLNYNNEVTKSNWLKSRQGKSKVISKNMIGTTKERRNPNILYNAANVIVFERHPDEIYSDPELLGRIENFDFVADETFEKDSAKSENVSRVDDFLDESDHEEGESNEEIRSQKFDERLLSSRSLNRLDVSSRSEASDVIELKSNPQEGLILQIPISTWKSHGALFSDRDFE